MASAVTLALALFTTEAAAASTQETLHQGLEHTDLAEEPELPTGVTPSDWSSIQDSISAHRHAFEATDGGFEASNPRFRWEARFDGTSALIRPATSDWSFGFALKAFGFEGKLQEVESPTFGTCVEGQEITYGWSNELSEWWINDKRGFEHGFTVHERPAQLGEMGASPLVFELDTLGSLSPRVNQARTGLSLHDDAGINVLRYDGLVAFDANGARLSAWLEVNERSVRICVEEWLAEYPILVDPLVQGSYIKASNTDDSDNFGSSVAASGDTLVVGARFEDSNATGIDGDQSNNSLSAAGAAYIFVRSGSSWTQQAYLKASNTGSTDRFGESVAVSGDTVVVGAPWERSNATGIGGDQSDNSAIKAGAAYVFVRSGSTWTQQAYLKASNSESLDEFGWSVAASGDTVAVGAYQEDSSATGIDGDQSSSAAPNSGATYVFIRSGSTWTQQAYLKASNTDAGDRFGESIAASGDTLVVGAPGENSNAIGIDGDQSNNTAFSSGAAYVFVRSGSTWTQQAYVKASNTGQGEEFGFSVAAFGDTVAVGAPRENSNATGIDGDQSNNSALNAGAAYVFNRSGTSWTQEAYLKASNTDAFDRFGESVAASGGIVVVGAPGEDSGATGIDGDQSSFSAGDSGAAYLFVRNGPSWTQEAYLKASNTDGFDEFGQSVAASGDTMVLGARFEDSSATGIDGDQSDNSASASGAVYTFDGIGVFGGVGTPYCMTAVNSTGVAGQLAGSGSSSAAANDLTLIASNLPVAAFGYFLTSTVQGFVMNPGGSEGNVCLGGAVGRYVGPGQIQQADASGRFSLLLDLTNTPQPLGIIPINPGETWNFQAWYRDTNMTGATSNFTNGLEVAFDDLVASFSYNPNTIGLRYSSFSDTSSGSPTQIAWDFNFNGNPADPAATFVPMVMSPAGAIVSHDFASTGAFSVALRATFANGDQSYSVQTVDVVAIVFDDIIGPGTEMTSVCSSCHNAAAPIENLPLTDSSSNTYNLLINVPVSSCTTTPGAFRVQPFSAANSYLFHITSPNSTPNCSGMPSFASQANANMIRDWIDQGAAFD